MALEFRGMYTVTVLVDVFEHKRRGTSGIWVEVVCAFGARGRPMRKKLMSVVNSAVFCVAGLTGAGWIMCGDLVFIEVLILSRAAVISVAQMAFLSRKWHFCRANGIFVA